MFHHHGTEYQTVMSEKFRVWSLLKEALVTLRRNKTSVYQSSAARHYFTCFILVCYTYIISLKYSSTLNTHVHVAIISYIYFIT